MREEFEQWVKSRGGDAMKRDGDYVSSMTMEWWKSWQSSRQSQVVKLPCWSEYDSPRQYMDAMQERLDAAGAHYE